ncbi:MAG TPA: hypothetical protein VNV37_10425 [Solirubrobacteraceae bacterium]|nr:hypothetical protein [Solirubrobacteraceae bacterium]
MPAAVAAARLLVVYREDPGKRYEWLGPPRRGDVIVAFDGLAHADLVDRGALLFDRLQSWEQRSAEEHHVDELLEAVRAHPCVAALGRGGVRLFDFAAFRLREELTRLLRGWSLGRAAPHANLLVCDPATPVALQMGARAALGLDPAALPYALAPALPGSLLKRALARPAMRAVAAGSRARRVRVAVVATGKLMPALAALSGDELRGLGVGTMPFPGLDHGNSALLALRRRLPMLATFGSSVGPSRAGVELPAQPLLARETALDRALGLLVSDVLGAAAPELQSVDRAIARLEGAVALRALLLPSAGYGAARLLTDWAHRRGMRVGVMQHGIYALRYRCEDCAADIVFSWGEGTAEQAGDWPEHPRLVRVGVPGIPAAPPRLPPASLRCVLVAGTGSGVDTPITPLTLDEEFLGVVAPGLARLAAAGVKLEMRPHPNEDIERYRRLVVRHGLPIALAAGGSFANAAARADIVIASVSSVAFEAAALGLPVLMWCGGAPESVRREYLTVPWTASHPGIFGAPDELGKLVGLLLERPADGLGVALGLRACLARYAQPFDPVRFADGVRLLGE